MINSLTKTAQSEGSKAKIFWPLGKAFSFWLLLLAVFVLIEPAVREKITFAVPFMDTSKVTYSVSADKQSVVKTSTTQRSHAPEPSTMILFLSGLSGMILRFARKSYDRFKRGTDMLLAVIGLALTTPLLAFAAVLIKIDSAGPIVYRQNRVGKRGKIFKIYKLRSMRLDAEKGTGAVWAKKNDPRITKIGKFLRKSHIDEIPQLINVLKGEMSIVGPRPERPEMVRDLKELIHDYEARLQIKPGITGLAQVRHKYDETIEDVRKKVTYDVVYIKRMCLWVDVRIMARTFLVAFTGKGAR